MDGFGSSKDRNKHFKKHVGEQKSSFGSGDMHGMFKDAKAYEQAGKDLFAKPTSAGGVVQISTRSNSVMRWDTSTGHFGAGDPTTRRLSTFHMKTPEQFLKSVSEQVPQALPRTISFTPVSPSSSSSGGGSSSSSSNTTKK